MKGEKPMDLVNVFIIFLKIAAPLCSIAFTYVKYRDFKKRNEKGSSDAGTSDKPDNSCSKDS